MADVSELSTPTLSEWKCLPRVPDPPSYPLATQEVHRMSTTGHDGKGGGDEGDTAAPGARSPQTMIRALDPTTARLTTGGVPARPTLYLTDRLLVRNVDVGGGRGLDSPELTDALRKAGVTYEVHRGGRGRTRRGLDAPGEGGP